MNYLNKCIKAAFANLVKQLSDAMGDYIKDHNKGIVVQTEPPVHFT